MTSPDAAQLYAVTEATWPPARRWRFGPWMIREGLGGGQRVSAATREDEFTASAISQAEQAMDQLGQPRLFMIRAGDEALDAELDARGYRIKDPVLQYTAAVDLLTLETPPPIATFAIWPPLAIMTELWAQGGIGPGRINVMSRVEGAKTAILSRQEDRAAGCAFVAVAGDVAMIHAIEVAERSRRQGAARNILRAAALWAGENGARHLSLIVTAANDAANALYSRMGMRPVGRYHYRIKNPD